MGKKIERSRAQAEARWHLKHPGSVGRSRARSSMLRYALPALVLVSGLGVHNYSRPGLPPALAGPAQPTSSAPADHETTPVRNRGDAADDQAIWVNPAKPEAFAVIGTDRDGALEVYDEKGARIQRITDGTPNNVDLRKGFSLGGKSVDLVGIADGGSGSLRFYTMDPGTRQLTNVTAGGNLRIGIVPFGFCMYHSPVSGKFYAFAQTPGGGYVEQVELFESAGKVSGKTVRSFDVGEKTEGCVADDVLKQFYISEQVVGIWKYGAEPGDSTGERTRVDKTGRGGHLTPDIEGLTIVHQPGDTGYLIASSQGENTFVVYRREGANEFVRELHVTTGSEADECSHTDGIDAVAAYMGPAFPQGVFSCQDNENTRPGTWGNQNFKYVRLEKIVDLVPTSPQLEGSTAPEFVGTAAADDVADESVWIDRPSRTTPGDVMIAAVSEHEEVTTPPRAPTGWTLIRADEVPGDLSLRLYYKVAASSEPSSYYWKVDDVDANGVILTYRGVDTASPVVASGATVPNEREKIMRVPSINVDVANTMLVAFGTIEGPTPNHIPPPSGFTARVQRLVHPSLAGCDRVFASKGETGQTTTEADAHGNNIVAILALRPSGRSMPKR